MFGITILGNNSAIPAFDRHPTAQAITLGDQVFLIDCGEATQMQISRYKVRWGRINHIFISHLHGDHYFGLPGLLTSMGLLGREAPLTVYCPEGLEQLINLQLQLANNTLRYPLAFKTHPAKGGLLVETSKFEITCFPVKHRVPCWGFVIREKKLPRKLIKEKLLEFEIPASYYHKLQEGNDYLNKDGQLIKNELVTIAAPAGKSYAYSADTLYDEDLIEHVSGVSVLYHEATYLHELSERAANRYHTTALQAGRLASLAKPGRLLLGHCSSKYEHLEPFVTEAQQQFDHVELAMEGTTYLV